MLLILLLLLAFKKSLLVLGKVYGLGYSVLVDVQLEIMFKPYLCETASTK